MKINTISITIVLETIYVIGHFFTRSISLHTILFAFVKSDLGERLTKDTSDSVELNTLPTNSRSIYNYSLRLKYMIQEAC